MAVNYSNLFTGIGEYLQRINDFRGYYSDLDTDKSEIETDMNSIGRLDVYSGTPELFDQFKSGLLGWISSFRSKIDQLLTHRTTVLEELAVGNQSDVQMVLYNMIRDMNDNSQTVNRSTVAIGSVTSDCQNTDVGTAILGKVMDRVNAPVIGGKANPEYKDVDCELAVSSETMTFTCTTDSENGASEGGERWSWVGDPSSGDPFDWQNRGSGQGPSLTTLNSDSTWFSNLGFEEFTANAPDDWIIVSGTAGTHILEETGASNIWGGSSGLELLGNGTLASIELTQEPTTALTPGKRYAFACWVKGNASLSAGTLTIQFTGTGYTPGSAEKIEMNLAALQAQTSFGLKYFFLNAPDDPPADFALQIKLSGTPSAHSIFVDTMAFGPVVWHGGIHANIVAGKNKFLQGDRLKVSITNDEAGVFQTFFGKAYRVQLPSSGSPSISDGLAS